MFEASNSWKDLHRLRMLRLYSEEKAEDFPSQMLPPGLLVVHDPAGGCQDDESELSAGQQVVGPLLDLIDGHIEPGRDNSALVESSSEIDDDLAGSVVIDNLKLPDVSVLHHDGQEPDDDLGAGSDEDLPLASLLCIVYTLQAVSQGVHTNHPAESLLLSEIKSDFRLELSTH